MISLNDKVNTLIIQQLKLINKQKIYLDGVKIHVNFLLQFFQYVIDFYNLLSLYYPLYTSTLAVVHKFMINSSITFSIIILFNYIYY